MAAAVVFRGTNMTYYGQQGEDKLIEDKLNELAASGVVLNQHCFEVGAADGIYISNTRHFLELGGWRVLLIEADKAAYRNLLRNRLSGAICVYGLCDTEMLEACMDASGFPLNPDFGVIDIDGEDYYFWQSMHRYRPRIVCIEHGASTPPDVLPLPGESKPGKHQAGRNRIVELGQSKGYEVFAENSVNVLFIDTEAGDEYYAWQKYRQMG